MYVCIPLSLVAQDKFLLGDNKGKFNSIHSLAYVPLLYVLIDCPRVMLMFLSDYNQYDFSTHVHL